MHLANHHDHHARPQPLPSQPLLQPYECLPPSRHSTPSYTSLTTSSTSDLASTHGTTAAASLVDLSGTAKGAMAEPWWRRGSSSTRKDLQRTPQHKSNLLGRNKGNKPSPDGFVPYRPPFVSSSVASFSPPVQPSGAQGIGLAPAAAQQRNEPKRGRFSEWLFGARRKPKNVKVTSASTPALLNFGSTTEASVAGGGHAHRPLGSQPAGIASRHHGSQPYLQSYGSTSVASYAPYGHSSSLGGQYGHLSQYNSYAPGGGQQSLGGELSTGHDSVKPSSSVHTGLAAPKMLFSPLSRGIQQQQQSPQINHSPFSSTPNLYTPPSDYPPSSQQYPPSPHTSRPYPRVGANISAASLPGQASRWPLGSAISLHSEGSKSRLAVSTMCDALTFPRPRFYAHDITPPDSPEQDSDADMDDGTPVFTRAYARSEARDHEREEWADFARRRSGSLRRSVDGPGTPGSRLTLGSTASSVDNPERPPHVRSRSASGSIRSLFSRQGRGRKAVSHDDLPRQGQMQQQQQARRQIYRASSVRDRPERSDSVRTGHSNSSRRTFGFLKTTPQSTPVQLPKSTSSPALPVHASAPYTPKRSQSVRYQESFTRSNPDLGGYPKAASTAGHGSPRGMQNPPSARRRQTGPPRSFQFRLNPPASKRQSMVPAAPGLVVVGAGSARTDGHLRAPPRSIDFAEPSRLKVSSDEAPTIPTPDRSSPFTYDFPESEIGLAITTSGNEAAAPPAHTQLPLDTPPSVRPPGIKEDPSSAHARYLLARQHRRDQTLRAFQSPPMSPTRKTASSRSSHKSQSYKSPSVIPQPTFSPASSVSHFSLMSPPLGAARPEYPTPHRQATYSRDLFSPSLPSASSEGHPGGHQGGFVESPPASPRSPGFKTSFFGSPIRSDSRRKSTVSTMRSKRSSVHTKSTKDKSPLRTPPKTPPRTSMSTDESADQSTVVPREKALPILPSTAPTKIPPQRPVPSHPIPPTPPFPPNSRNTSTSSLDRLPSRSGSLMKKSGSGDQLSRIAVAGATAAAAGGMYASTLTSSPPSSAQNSRPASPAGATLLHSTLQESPTANRHAPVPPMAPAPPKRQITPPPLGGALPTIMDESPTPIRQTRVAVLAPERESPQTPVPGTVGPLAQLTSPSPSFAASGSISRSPLALFAGHAESGGGSLPIIGSTKRERPKLANVFGGTNSPASLSFRSVRSKLSSASQSSLVAPVSTMRDSMASASSVSLYSDASEGWQRTRHHSNKTSSSADSDATMPDFFPMSSTSALSHYEDAESNQDDGVLAPLPVDVVASEQSSFDIEDNDADSNSPPPGRSARSTMTEVPDSHRTTILPSEAQRLALLEQLSETPRQNARVGESLVSPESGSEELLHERRNSGGSSGSDASMRPSFDESFRGLFFRTPQVASPNPNRSSGALHRLGGPTSPLPARANSDPSNPSGFHSLMPGSPREGEGSDGTFEIRTPIIPFPRSPMDGPASLTPMQTSPGLRQGLGIAGFGGSHSSPNTASLGGAFETGRLEPSPMSAHPRDDSWITESFRLSQASGRATPLPMRSLSARKSPRDSNDMVSFSPTTFGVSTASFETQSSGSLRTPRKSSGSSTSLLAAVTPITPNPDVEVVRQFPSPPHGMEAESATSSSTATGTN